MKNLAKHDTPEIVAHMLAEHAPKEVRRMLDPAVGSGVLLKPFLVQKRICPLEVVAIDLDAPSIDSLGKTLRPSRRLRPTLVNESFLRWRGHHASDGRNTALFDCIVMNPPFAAQRKSWVKLKSNLFSSELPVRDIKCPIEAAFVLKAVSLLRLGGRLLAILPSSLVSSDATSWVRKHLVERGAILHVHELPRFTFPDIESRIYLFVFERGPSKRFVQLLNHDLKKPQSMKVSVSALDDSVRLDYGYNSAKSAYERVRKKKLDWRTLQSVATVSRGKVKKLSERYRLVHVCDNDDFTWQEPTLRRNQRLIVSDLPLTKGDILVKRVSRRCTESFGLWLGKRRVGISDCVLLIRPKSQSSQLKLLFLLRTMFGSSLGTHLLERGTGASYLSKHHLERLLVPWGLVSRFTGQYEEYKHAATCHDFSRMKAVEQEVRSGLGISSSCG